MLPDPLHPAVVHFPIVLTFLLPISALIAVWAIRRGAAPRKAWAVPVAFAAALAASSWLAIQTGEREEDRVEEVVAEQALETHEEAAEQFVKLSFGLLALTAIGLVGGRAGTSARFLATVGAAALIVAAARVGGSGGELVYRHGAASAYVPDVTRATATADRNRTRSDESRDDDARRDD